MNAKLISKAKKRGWKWVGKDSLLNDTFNCHEACTVTTAVQLYWKK